MNRILGMFGSRVGDSEWMPQSRGPWRDHTGILSPLLDSSSPSRVGVLRRGRSRFHSRLLERRAVPFLSDDVSSQGVGVTSFCRGGLSDLCHKWSLLRVICPRIPGEPDSRPGVKIYRSTGRAPVGDVMMAILRRVWRILVHLFGLETCPLPPQMNSSRSSTKDDHGPRRRT